MSLKKNTFAAALAAASVGAFAAFPANAQEPTTNNGGAPAAQPGGAQADPGPSALNPGGVQGRPNGGQGVFGGAGSQVEGTPSGAAAQGNSAGGGSLPAAQGGASGTTNRSGLPAMSGGSSRIRVSTSNALTPIVNRVQDMLRIADSRKIDAPNGAARSYASSSRALRQMLSAAGYGSAASSSLPASGSGVRAASLASLPLSSEQITEDIRVLRSLSQQAGARKQSGGLSKDQMNRVASLYATGAKEFFTGQLREALFESPVQVSLRSNGSRVEGPSASDGQMATGIRVPDVSTAARVRADRPNVPFPITLQRPQQQPEMTAEGVVPPTGVLQGDVPGTNAQAAAAAGMGGTADAGPGASVYPTVPAPNMAPGASYYPTFPNSGQGFLPPNLNFAPGYYGGGFFGPPALIQGFVPGGQYPAYPGLGYPGLF